MAETKQNKEIYFCIDSEAYRNFFAVRCKDKYGTDRPVVPDDNNKYAYALTYDSTEDCIRCEEPYIVTMSMAHLSFDLIKMGYDIYLCYKKKAIRVEPHMDLSGIGEPCKDLRFGHNLFKLFRAGVFNQLLCENQ